MAQSAFGGLSWITLGNVLARFAGLAGQLVLGWFLTPRDFGIYAIAVGISGAASALRNGGISQVLVTSGDSYASRASLYVRFAGIANVTAAILLLTVAAALMKKQLDLAFVIAGVALSFPVGTYGSVLRGELTILGRYRALTMINIGSALAWQLCVCALAWQGFGAKSFALPPLVQAATETALAWVFVGRIPRPASYGRKDYLDLFRSTRWIILSAWVLALATTGDYFAVGLVTTLPVTGAYFFAFQLAASLGTPINASIDTVLPTVLARARHDAERQRSIYHTTANFVLLLVLPACIGVAFMIPPIVNLAWSGKWDYACPAIQLFIVCIPAWLLFGIGRSLLDACGLWRTRFAVIAVYGIGGISSAALGAISNDPNSIAAIVTIFYDVFAVGLCLLMGRLVQWPGRSHGPPVIFVVIVNFVALSVGLGLAARTATYFGNVHVIASLIYLGLLSIGTYMFLRREFQNLLLELWRQVPQRLQPRIVT